MTTVLELTAGGRAEQVVAGSDELPVGTPVLILIGSAQGLVKSIEELLAEAFVASFRPRLAEYGVTVVDGGTSSGVMQVAARTLSGDDRLRLVGVVPSGETTGDHRGSPVELAANHTIVKVEGAVTFGDERTRLIELAETIAAGRTILVVLAGGGVHTREELRHVLRRDWPVLLLVGTGGLADEMADLGPRRAMGRRRSASDPSHHPVRRKPIRRRARKRLHSVNIAAVSVDNISEINRHLRWAFDPNDILRDAWRTMAAFDREAARARACARWINGSILALVVLANAAALFFLAGDGSEALKYSLVIFAAAGSALVSWAGRRARDHQWVAGRVSAEEIRRATFLYRTHELRKPSDGWAMAHWRRIRDHISREDQSDGGARAAADLAVAVTTAETSYVSTQAPLPPPQTCWAVPPNLSAAVHRSDELLDPIDGDQYRELRVRHQIAYFQSTGRAQDRRWATLILGILILIATSTALVGFPTKNRESLADVLVVAASVAITLATTLGTWTRYLQLEQQVVQKRATYASLGAIDRAWAAQGSRPRGTNVEQLVRETEAILDRENSEWSQIVRHPRDLVTAFGTKAVT